MPSLEHWIVTFVCPDKPGIVHAISGAVVAINGNITESQQYSSEDTGRFFMRLQIEAAVETSTFEASFRQIAETYQMDWRLDHVGRKMRTVVLGTRAQHCVNDLLFRAKAGQLPISVAGVIANHAELSPLAGFFGVEFQSWSTLDSAQRQEFEIRLRQFIAENQVELIVLARFMQVLSDEFCRDFEGRIINIHHSFLPGFKGAKPYAQAHERGVKLIGATAHFVTSELDEGPIIEQHVTRVSHKDSVDRLVAIGQDVESRTLTQAVRWFAEHRVLIDGKRTVIFS